MERSTLPPYKKIIYSVVTREMSVQIGVTNKYSETINSENLASEIESGLSCPLARQHQMLLLPKVAAKSPTGTGFSSATEAELVSLLFLGELEGQQLLLLEGTETPWQQLLGKANN